MKKGHSPLSIRLTGKTTYHLLQLLQFGHAREVPVGSLDIFGQTHDVVGMAVPSSPNHAVQHELQVAGRGGIADEEQAGFPRQGPKGHGLAHNLEWLGLLECIACHKKD